MKFKQKIVSIGILGSLAVLVGCQDAQVNNATIYQTTQVSPSKSNLQDMLVVEISKLGKMTGKPSFTLKSLTQFDWDKVHIFPPYTSPDLILKSLRFTWQESEKIRLGERDDITLLVFVKNNQVVEYLSYPRSKGDFADIKALDGLTPSQAVFTVSVDRNSFTKLSLASPPK